MGYTEFSSSYSNIFTSGHLRSAPINRTASVFILISICQQTSHSSLNLALLPVNVLFQGNCAMSITLLLNQQCEMLKQWRHQKSTSELRPRTPSVLSDSHGCQWYLRCSCLFQRVFIKLPWRVLFLCVCVSRWRLCQQCFYSSFFQRDLLLDDHTASAAYRSLKLVTHQRLQDFFLCFQFTSITLRLLLWFLPFVLWWNSTSAAAVTRVYINLWPCWTIGVDRVTSNQEVTSLVTYGLTSSFICLSFF